MAGLLSNFDVQEVDDFDASNAIGAKVLEMADRLKVADAVAPGSTAAWGFEVDGTRYELRMVVKPLVEDKS